MSQLHDIGYTYDDSTVTSNELFARCSQYGVLTMKGACFFNSFLILHWNSSRISKMFN